MFYNCGSDYAFIWRSFLGLCLFRDSFYWKVHCMQLIFLHMSNSCSDMASQECEGFRIPTPFQVEGSDNAGKAMVISSFSNFYLILVFSILAMMWWYVSMSCVVTDFVVSILRSDLKQISLLLCRLALKRTCLETIQYHCQSQSPEVLLLHLRQIRWSL